MMAFYFELPRNPWQLYNTHFLRVVPFVRDGVAIQKARRIFCVLLILNNTVQILHVVPKIVSSAVSNKYAYVRKVHMWLKNDFSGCFIFCDNHF